MPHCKKLQLAICDDLQSEREKIHALSDKVLTEAQIDYDCREFDNAEGLLAAIRSGAQYQILLLDVMMDHMDGMELARLLRRESNGAAIIFVSSNRDMALQGYEVSAARYLAKPVEEEKLREALMYCWKELQGKQEILLPADGGQCRISLADVQYAEAFDRGTRFVLDGETVETKLKFSEAEELLPKNAFILCHRAYIVNAARVRRIRPYVFELRSGVQVPISKYRYSEVSNRFSRYITE